MRGLVRPDAPHWGVLIAVIDDSMWERACSRKRCVIQHMHRMTYRIREQARSHNGGVCKP